MCKLVFSFNNCTVLLFRNNYVLVVFPGTLFWKVFTRVYLERYNAPFCTFCA